MKDRIVDVPMAGREILAVVASIAVDPHCPTCGGPAQLDTDDQGHVLVIVDHEPGCDHAEDGQNRRSEA